MLLINLLLTNLSKLILKCDRFVKECDEYSASKVQSFTLLRVLGRRELTFEICVLLQMAMGVNGWTLKLGSYC